MSCYVLFEGGSKVTGSISLDRGKEYKTSGGTAFLLPRIRNRNVNDYTMKFGRFHIISALISGQLSSSFVNELTTRLGQYTKYTASY
jgi:hypothetical protein